MAIEVSNLTKIYGTQRAVDAASFQVKPGAITAFLGPNGAGKSTTMKILTGFIPATSGKAYICGIDVSTHSTEARKIIGYLPEHNPLYLDMYVQEFLEFCGRIYQLSPALIRSRIKQVIDDTGLGSHKHKKLGQLSKGFRQRAGLAAAILHDPKVLILDEPTTGLDPNQIIEIRTLIQHLGKDKTVLLSTHIMQEVEQICTRAIIINKGKIVLDDTVANIKASKQTQEEQYIFEIDFSELVSWQTIQTYISGMLPLHLDSVRGNTLVCSSTQDVRQPFIKLCAQHDLPLLQIRLLNKHIEDVFKQYTQEQ